VRAASAPEEQEALNVRHEAALSNLSPEAARVLGELEAAVGQSRAIIARSLVEAQRLANSDNELYATYYGLIEAGVRVPSGSKWDVLRAVTDEAIFAGYKKEIRFAALSLNGFGLSNYGECSLVLKDEMIAHRSSVFEENTVLWMEHLNVKVSAVDRLPKGFRATWQERGKLACAKLAGRITPETNPESFPHLLLSQGETSADDDFIEVHIWGPVSARTLECVNVTSVTRDGTLAILEALREKLGRLGIPVDVGVPG
jgi:hypothetical protein